MEKLMQLAAKKAKRRAAKKAKKSRGTKAKARPAGRSDAQLAADLRAAAENYNAALSAMKAADVLLDKTMETAQAAGLGVVQQGVRGMDEIRFTEISRPL